MVEEIDPVERMRQRYRLGDSAASTEPRISTLEEELEATMKKINLKDFDYKPVPRPEEDE